MHYLKKCLFFRIPLLYCYIDIRLSIIFCLFYEDVYLLFGISLSCSFVIVSELFFYELLETFVILLAILSPIKPPVASFQRSFKCIFCRLFSVIKKFLAVFIIYVFTYTCTHIFSKRQKSIAFYKYSMSWLK